jgi:hypothetical protein
MFEEYLKMLRGGFGDVFKKDLQAYSRSI